MNQRKCTNCGTWNATDVENCSACGQLIDPRKLASVEKTEQIEEREAIREANEGKLTKWVSSFQNSPSLFKRAIYFIISTLATIYMAFVSFFIWLIALISG